MKRVIVTFGVLLNIILISISIGLHFVSTSSTKGTAYAYYWISSISLPFVLLSILISYSLFKYSKKKYHLFFLLALLYPILGFINRYLFYYAGTSLINYAI